MDDISDRGLLLLKIKDSWAAPEKQRIDSMILTPSDANSELVQQL